MRVFALGWEKIPAKSKSHSDVRDLSTAEILAALAAFGVAAAEPDPEGSEAVH
jgi:hypothetical protein